MNLLTKYKSVRLASEQMVEPLHIEDYVPQAATFASPPKWNLGHTTWFFEEFILKPHSQDYKVFDESYSFLFNSYYNTVGERVTRANRGSLSRPLVSEVMGYRKHVDKAIQQFLQNSTLTKDIEDIFIVGINHEQQHQELFFTDLKYNFSVNPTFPAYNNKAFCEDEESETMAWLAIEKGIYDIGHQGDGFCYDNELGAHQVLLQDFEISNKLITNGEYLEFLKDGGYNKFEFWHDEALFWLKDKNISHPMYWLQKDGKWFQYTLAGLRLLQDKHILTHLSYYEAAAFAQWKGHRLPTEFEWEAACHKFDWGKRWEWTESAYSPYPNYKKPNGAIGEYNGKFMVNQKVLRGGSVVTPQGHSRKTYRNFFHPHIAYQFNGIRLVK
ncbi:ergothioneine biosynthesis protein EgtB [Carboxylicivirga sp. N1Y90]|uniref:ergothioneine biosynthesis protein EgtB n=1 Tax=Carboxylicivirga fragile TaxID=3417571 RepID=UPI003D353CE2|nr:ergothioneine biosynthesis protein EgtB [Marinilabiliaceae bacterium N1Y90]